MISNFSLLFLAIAKAALLTGFGPGVIILGFVRCAFPFCVLRDCHDDDHDVRVPIERFEAFEQLGLFKSSGGGELVRQENRFHRSGATSPPRKVRHA